MNAVLQGILNIYVLIKEANDDERVILRRTLKLYYTDLDKMVTNIENAAPSKADLIDLSDHRGMKE